LWKIHPVTYIDLTTWAPYEVEQSELKIKLMDIMTNVDIVLILR